MDGRIKDRKRTRQLLREIGRPGGRLATVSVAMPFLSGLLILAQAYVLADILHRSIVNGEAIGSLLNRAFLLAGVFAIRSMLSFVGERAAAGASESIKSALRAELFGRLMAGKPGDVGTKASGAVAISLIEHVDQLDGYYARFRPALIQASCLPLAFGFAVFKADVIVALLFLVTAPMIPIFMALAGWGAEAAMRDQTQAMTRLSGHFADRLRGIMTLKLFGRAASETAAVRNAGETLRKRTLGVLKIAFLSSAVLEFFAALGVAGVALYVGLTYLGFLHIAGAMTLRTGLFCLLMAPEVYQPLRLLAAHYHDKKSAESALDEVELQTGSLDSLQSPASFPVPDNVVEFQDAGSGLSVAINGLSLFTPTGRTILHDVDMQIPAGGHAVLLGESSAGKSSLLQAIARLRAYEGQIVIGDRLSDDLPNFIFRRRVSVLNQMPFLFRGSIADNLRLASPDATDAQLRRAGDMACLFDDTASSSLRLDTMVGDRGVGLSGGQVQRLSMARIFLRDAGLLLLDEPTAHLDRTTELRVLEALSEFAVGRTMLIATHSQPVIDRFPHAFRIRGASVIAETEHFKSLSQADAA